MIQSQIDVETKKNCQVLQETQYRLLYYIRCAPIGMADKVDNFPLLQKYTSSI